MEQDRADEGLLQDEGLDRGFSLKKYPLVDEYGRRCISLTWTWIIQSAMLACSLTLFILSWSGRPSDETCVRKLFPYSLEAVEYHDETLPGAFLQPSPYRGTPTPDIDARWEKLWDWGAFNVPEDKIPLLNKSTDDPWHHTDPSHGGGVAGLFWGFHQIHCLDLLRQMSYKEEYEKSGQRLPSILRDPEALRRTHLDHCIELIRMDMMCQADVTPYLVLDRPDDSTGALNIDFSVFKRCRDFGKVANWMKDHIAISSVRDSEGHHSR
ncbi:DUF3328 domain protein [Metarhizium robertsii]|uniref:DUF3328 domain protein n=1 Tax=Metarhizium robertsii TaxID=568076 RepID=A0A014N3G8_9HYPO|nr:DUF3328 domain protein [Metarhizium robertsii]